MAKGCIVALILPLGCYLFLPSNFFHVSAIIMEYFPHLNKKDVLQQEYSRPPILHSPHFNWVVKLVIE